MRRAIVPSSYHQISHCLPNTSLTATHLPVVRAHGVIAAKQACSYMGDPSLPVLPTLSASSNRLRSTSISATKHLTPSGGNVVGIFEELYWKPTHYPAETVSQGPWSLLNALWCYRRRLPARYRTWVTNSTVVLVEYPRLLRVHRQLTRSRDRNLLSAGCYSAPRVTPAAAKVAPTSQTTLQALTTAYPPLVGWSDVPLMSNTCWAQALSRALREV